MLNKYVRVYTYTVRVRNVSSENRMGKFKLFYSRFLLRTKLSPADHSEM